MKRQKSIFRILKLRLALVILVLSTFAIILNYYFLKKNQENQYVFLKKNIIQQVKKSFVYPLWHINRKEISLVADSLLQNEIVTGIKVVLLPTNEVLYEKNDVKNNKDIQKVYIQYKNKKIGYIDIFFSQQFFTNSLKYILLTNLILVIIVVAIILFLTNLLIENVISIPIKNINYILKLISKGNFNKKEISSNYEEFDDIYYGINTLVEKISERESQLKESERKFRSVAENIPVGILIYEKGNLAYCNKAARLIFDAGIDEIKNLFIRQIEYYNKHEFLKCKLFQSKGREELKYVTTEGVIKYLDIIMDHIDFNRDIGHVFVVIDNTEYKRALAEIEKLQKLLKNILDSVPSSVFTIDSDFNILYWNKVFLNTYAKDEKSLKGKNIFEIIELDNRIKEKIKAAMESKKEEFVFRQIKDEAGDSRYENIAISPLVSNGVEGMVIKIDDVTDYIKFEERLIQSDKMITIGNMAAGIAHEINNPLAIIMQATDVLLNRFANSQKNFQWAQSIGIDFEHVEKYVKNKNVIDLLMKIKVSTDRAANIIRSLSFFASGGKDKVQKVNIVDLIENTLNIVYTDYSLREKYDIKKIVIKKEYKDVPFVECEPGKIQLVFLNIIKNAAQAMAGMENPQLVIKVDSDRDYVFVEFKDNGPGIEENIKKYIFDPFFTTREVGEGTGLGLYTSYIVVKQHGGFIDVSSSPNKGASFKIYLPTINNQ